MKRNKWMGIEAVLLTVGVTACGAVGAQAANAATSGVGSAVSGAQTTGASEAAAPAHADDKGGAAATPNADGASEKDKDLTERFESTNEECGTKLTGKMASKSLSVSYCSNISDGLRYVCQDNKANKAVFKGVTTVVCADVTGGSATIKRDGATLVVGINDTMDDPSERVRCVAAKAMKVTYKGDLDAACAKRKH
ncbi:MAG: hypothetical protein KC657_36480 [Myxococcales bacterium]|nr:hypothetical protein [Myxococcales bacterium]